MRTKELKSKIVMLAGNKEFYGYEIHKILESQGITIEISRLYRVLNEMLKEKIFSSRWEKSQSGPKKRIYKLDIEGKNKREEMLCQAIGIVHKFYGEYLQSLPSELNVVKKIRKKTSPARIYLIKPDLIKFDLNLENLMFIEGNYSSIPLKDDYLDLLVVIGIPKKDLFRDSLNEWKRLLNSTGKLTLVAPTVLIDDYKDPKNIGEFFEEFEHNESHQIEKIGTETIMKELEKLFKNIEKTKIVHVTLFRASEPIF
ncbi:MAG: helix-turn-helix transcriptional regulator [Candidatus Bathyarchaeota archaeon]